MALPDDDRTSTTWTTTEETLRESRTNSPNSSESLGLTTRLKRLSVASFTGSTASHLPASREGNRNDSHFYSQFNDEDFLQDHRATPRVIGRGGVPVPTDKELSKLVKNEHDIKVMCFTWNINQKPHSSIRSVNELFGKIALKDRPDVFAVALQELPSTTLRFHSQMVASIEESIDETHRCFCWVRKWSQLLLVFIKKHLSLYTSRPEYQFVSSSTFSKPFRTKGAIGICFRILQSSFVFISCHFSHSSFAQRVLDYEKASASFNFRCTLTPNSTTRTDHTIFNADNVFWFGDMNFRLRTTLRDSMQELADIYSNKLFFRRNVLDLTDMDELKHAQKLTLAFHCFEEAKIEFPSTYKFRIGTNVYAKHREPAFTDRILYRSKHTGSIVPIRYDAVWHSTVSDHKAVYGIYMVRVISNSQHDNHSPCQSCQSTIREGE